MILFVYNLMIGCPSKKRKSYSIKALELRDKETRIKI